MKGRKWHCTFMFPEGFTRKKCFTILLSLSSRRNNRILLRRESKLAKSLLFRRIYVDLKSHRASAKAEHTEQRIYRTLIFVPARRS